MLIREPNVFLVGAPRCGTTALCAYLGEHDNIFVPRLKEPYYFASDFDAVREVDSLPRYQQLFRSASDKHRARIDGSVLYMYSNVAVEEIREFNDDARILIMVRNPIDMLYSLHSRLIATFAEDEEDFEKAWRLQDARRRNEQIPEGCRTPALLQYRNVGKLGAQTQRVLDVFPRRNVHIVLFEDFVSDTALTYRAVLQFLGLPEDGRQDFTPRNTNITGYRFPALARFLHNPPAFVGHAERVVKKAIGLETLGIIRAHQKVTGKRASRKPITESFRAELREAFRDDIDLLSSIVDRDLSHWD